MSGERINRILRNTKFSMEMEGFTIEKEQEDKVRKLLIGEMKLEDYIESINQKARKYAYEV